MLFRVFQAVVELIFSWLVTMFWLSNLKWKWVASCWEYYPCRTSQARARAYLRHRGQHRWPVREDTWTKEAPQNQPLWADHPLGPGRLNWQFPRLSVFVGEPPTALRSAWSFLPWAKQDPPLHLFCRAAALLAHLGISGEWAPVCSMPSPGLMCLFFFFLVLITFEMHLQFSADCYGNSGGRLQQQSCRIQPPCSLLPRAGLRPAPLPHQGDGLRSTSCHLVLQCPFYLQLDCALGKGSSPFHQSSYIKTWGKKRGFFWSSALKPQMKYQE